MKNKTSLRKWFGYLGFDYLIAPFLIKVIYWGGVVLVLSAGIGGSFAIFDMPDKSVAGVLIPVGVTMLALLIWRLLCELLILAFNIYERLVEIRNLLSHRQARVDAYQKIPSVRVLKND